MHRYEVVITHRPDREGRPVTYRHVPFYLALETASAAWGELLDITCAGVLGPADLAVVNVTSDFRHEVFTEPATFDVRLRQIGRTSITFEVELTQNGRSAATVRMVLARVEESRLHAIPFSSAQRAALQQILEPSAA